MTIPEYSFGNTLIKIENVCLEYDGRPILKNVNCNIRDVIRPGCVTGQVVSLLGPSGIGKTQLFRIISGLNKPTSGQVILNGFNRPVQAGEVGVVAQSYPLFEHRSVFSNLLLAANNHESDPKVARDKAISLLQEFDLGDKALLYPSQLSGGQRQRVAIIQQILCSEHFLLMDEPFSGLDLIMLEKTLALISRIAMRDELNTVVIVTHDVTAAASISDHMYLLGRDKDEKGEKIPGAHIVKEYNLIDEGLCYQPNIITSPRLMEFVGDVKERFRDL